MDNWIDQIEFKTKKVYSQGNQDGIIEYIFENIGTTNKFCVEFGFNSDTLTGGTGANTARLVVEDKWKCLLLDGSHENISINLHKEFLTFENIGNIFKKYLVPLAPDYISIDVDSIDLWLMKSLLITGYRPRLFSVEYNSNFPLEYSYTANKETRYIKDMVYGASLLALNKVAEQFDYTLIAGVRTLDLFFLRNDLLTCIPPSIEKFKNLTSLQCHGPSKRERFKCFIEYPSLIPLSDELLNQMPQIFRINDKT